MGLPVILVIGFSFAGLTLALLGSAAAMPSLASYRISDDPHRAIDSTSLYKKAVVSLLLSTTLISITALSLQGFLFNESPIVIWRVLLEAATVILIYDFLYYFVHRFAFHEWRPLRGAHSVHHAAHNPRVIDALLLHPIENVLGITLLFVSISIVGGIHLVTFAPIFIAYSTLNLINHSGIALPWFPFKTIGVLAIKHDRHHHSMLSGNYASITPLPDYVFGTLE